MEIIIIINILKAEKHLYYAYENCPDENDCFKNKKQKWKFYNINI